MATSKSKSSGDAEQQESATSGGGPQNIWVGGVVKSSRAQVEVNGEKYPAACALWVAPKDGTILALQAGAATERALLAAALMTALENPIVATAGKPDVMLVTSAAERDIIGISGLLPEVPCHHHAEAGTIVTAIAQALRWDEPEGAAAAEVSSVLPTEHPHGFAPEAVSGILRALFDLAVDAPWVRFTDADLFEVTWDGTSRAVVSIIGNGGLSYGFLVFASMKDYRAMRKLDQAAGPDVTTARLPSFLACSLDSLHEVPRAAREHVATYAPDWLRHRRIPILSCQSTAGPPATELTREHCQRLGIVASALTTAIELAGEKKWPNNPGDECVVAMPEWSGLQKATVLFVGRTV